jgi:hypothetical protein
MWRFFCDGDYAEVGRSEVRFLVCVAAVTEDVSQQQERTHGTGHNRHGGSRVAIYLST